MASFLETLLNIFLTIVGVGLGIVSSILFLFLFVILIIPMSFAEKLNRKSLEKVMKNGFRKH